MSLLPTLQGAGVGRASSPRRVSAAGLRAAWCPSLVPGGLWFPSRCRKTWPSPFHALPHPRGSGESGRSRGPGHIGLGRGERL